MTLRGFRLALLAVAIDLIGMAASTCAVVHYEGTIRVVCVCVLVGNFLWFRHDWPKLHGYLVEQGGREQ